jgi:predicted DNA-binding transcriptional regulator
MTQPTQDDRIDESSLRGTTMKVYRLLLRSHNPVGIHDVQRALGLSSPSVAQYHLKKLLGMKLIREENEGYVIDKVVIDNVIRIRRTAIPLQTAYVAFFAASLVVMLTVFRAQSLSPAYLFAIAVMSMGMVITAYEAVKTFGHL